MSYIKYLPVLFLLFVVHYLAGNMWLIATWSLLGILSVTWIREAKFPLINILVMEVITGLLFWLLFWNRDHSLHNLSDNAGTSSVLLPVAAIVINSITALLCAAVAMIATKRIMIARNRN